MGRFSADEQFPYRIVEALREFGHDVLNVQGTVKRGRADEDVLAFAIQENRAILPFNRQHFMRLHNQQPNHTSMIVCEDDPDREGIALRINAAIAAIETLNGMLIRVNRPG